MKELHSIFKQEITKLRKKIILLIKKKGETPISDIKLKHLFQGQRGLPLLYTPTSNVNATTGLSYRNKTIKKLHTILPRFQGHMQPPSESLLWFLLTGTIPTIQQTERFRKYLHTLSHIPQQVFNVIDALPQNTSCTVRFSTGLLACSSESQFKRKYDQGFPKEKLWELAYNDALNLIAKIPHIAAYIYRKYIQKKKHIKPNIKLDWAGNLAHMMGFKTLKAQELIRIYIFTHADHSSAAVSTHTVHLVGSALSNMFYSYTAGMLGLAGPLHGYANQHRMLWLQSLIDAAQKEKTSPINKEFLIKQIKQRIKKGEVIPGYGHAVLRVEDPRYTLLSNFAKSQKLSSTFLNMVYNLDKIIPSILKKEKKNIANPYPNVDAISGTLLHSHGITEYQFYTLLFGVSRAIGVSSQFIIDRALQMPIERPLSVGHEIFSIK